MCGIHGFINSKTAEHNSDDFIKDGCVAGMLRGVDSTGVAVIDTARKDVNVRKLPLPGNFFIEDRIFNKMLPDIRSAKAITIAHTRAATVGKVAAATAHPFRFTNDDETRELVGVHNGTLTGWSTKSGGRDYDVDSQWALARIFEQGTEAFKDFTGAYCFVWWDSDTPDKLYIARNAERPMHVAFTDKGGMAYASEPGMLAWLAERRNIKIDGDIKALKPGLMYTFDLNDISDVTTKELPKSSVTYYGSSTTNYTPRYSGKTTVAQVEDFIKKVTAEAAGEASDVEEDASPFDYGPLRGVTKEEVDDARHMEVLSTRVKFRPSHTDNKTNILFGSVDLYESDGAWEVDAIMRDAGGVQWTKDEELDVTILGANMSPNDLLVIVSKPRIILSVVPKATTEQTVTTH